MVAQFENEAVSGETLSEERLIARSENVAQARNHVVSHALSEGKVVYERPVPGENPAASS